MSSFALQTIQNDMKHILILLLFISTTVGMTAQNKVIRKQNDGTYVVNTKSLTRKVKGYNGPTPVEIHIKNDKIVKVKALTNYESQSYFEKIKQRLLPLWEGMTVKKAASAEVDAVSGATVSSEAVKQNVKIGLEYYLKNK